MRKYGYEYRAGLQEAARDIRDCVESYDYQKNFEGITVNGEHQYLLNACVGSANDAHDQFSTYRTKVRKLTGILVDFYDRVDVTASDILSLAERINGLIIESSDTLLRMESALYQVGDFEGKRVTASILAGAGVDKELVSRLHNDLWAKIIRMQIISGKINEELATYFVQRIDSMIGRGETLPSMEAEYMDHLYLCYLDKYKTKGSIVPADDMKIVENLFNYHLEHRFGGKGNAREMDLTSLQSCIFAYELINPDAREKFDTFFKEAAEKKQEDIDLSIACIKYTTYTAKPEYRDVIFYYLPELSLNILPIGEVCNCSGKVINLVLEEDNDHKLDGDCSFSHEIGHAIDHLSFEDNTDENGKKLTKSSDAFADMLKSDLRIHMKASLYGLGFGSMPEEHKDDVVNFIMSTENTNVSLQSNDNYFMRFLPVDWKVNLINTTDKRIDAFKALRRYYGYSDYVYVPNSDDVFSKEFHRGFVGYGPENSVLSDIIGGITNDQIGANGGHSLSQKRLLKDDVPIDQTSVPDAETLHSSLKEYNYWYLQEYDDVKPEEVGTLNGHFTTEYFAEMFSLRVHDIDDKKTRSVFLNSTDMFDETYKNIYSDISEK